METVTESLSPNENPKKRQIELLNSLFSEALKHKDQQIGDRWKNVDRAFLGSHSRFDGTRKGSGDGWKSDTKVYLVYSYYLSVLATLMRDIPYVSLSGRISAHDEIAKEVAKLIALDLKKNEFAEREEELLYSGTLYGRACWKVTWDGRMNDGVGGIRIDVVSAKNLLLQPGKTRVRDCAYLFEMQTMDKLSLLTLYPDRLDEINHLFSNKKDSALAEVSDTKSEGYAATRADGTGLTMYYDARAGQVSSDDSVTVVEAWMYDPETIERFGWVVEASAGKLEAVKRKRNFFSYPTGRYIRFSGDVIFEDRPNPLPCFPYIEYVNMSMDGVEWPNGDIDALIPIQENYELRNNQANDATNQAIGGRETYIDGTSGLKPEDTERWTNQPGEIRRVADVNGVRTIEGYRVPPEIFTSMQHIQNDFDRISGSPEIIPIITSTDVRSGAGFDTISELVRGRFKLKTYSIESSVAELAKVMTRMIGLFYQRGVHYPFNLDLVGIRPDMFDYQVRAGLNLPASRRAQEQYLLQLFDRGAVDQEYVIEQSDLPNKETLLERMKPVWERPETGDRRRNSARRRSPRP